MFLKILQISQKNVFAGVPFIIKLQAGNLKLSEAATGNVLLAKVFSKRLTGVSEPSVHTSLTQFLNNSQSSQQNLGWSLFLIKLQI